MDGGFSLDIFDYTLPDSVTEALQTKGFVVIPGPIAVERMAQFAEAYDDVMCDYDSPDFGIGTTTTRMLDFVNRGPEFDEVYLHSPLLAACHCVIGEPFKLSSTLGRTLRPHTAAQDLHVDIERDSKDLPMVGFILMIDDFGAGNGATRFVPGSHLWPEVPLDTMTDCKADYDGQTFALGSAGSMIVFNGSIWHGHTANATNQPRRSIQGYFVRRNAQSGIDQTSRIRPETIERLRPLARYLLAL